MGADRRRHSVRNFFTDSSARLRRAGRDPVRCDGAPRLWPTVDAHPTAPHRVTSTHNKEDAPIQSRDVLTTEPPTRSLSLDARRCLHQPVTTSPVQVNTPCSGMAQFELSGRIDPALDVPPGAGYRVGGSPWPTVPQP